MWKKPLDKNKLSANLRLDIQGEGKRNEDLAGVLWTEVGLEEQYATQNVFISFILNP